MPYILPYGLPLDEPISDTPSAPTDLPPSGEPFSLTYPIPTYFPTEEPTFSSEALTAVPTLVLNSETNNYFSSSGYPSRLPSTFPPDISLREHKSVPESPISTT